MLDEVSLCFTKEALKASRDQKEWKDRIAKPTEA